MNEKLKERIGALAELGKILRNDKELDSVVTAASSANPWFTREFSHHAIRAITDNMLDFSLLEQWLCSYDIHDAQKAWTVGIVMAGNLPLVGFHDFLCTYVAGHHAKVRLSTKDDILFPYIFEKLSQIDQGIRNGSRIIDRLEGFDAVIATGSDNSNRYFEYYFREYPKILRRNRHSVAILSGNETDEELFGLADDIFMYFGFGCRNVSKIYIPEGYEIEKLFPYFECYKWMHDHNKYMNNYDYNRTLLLMNRTPHLANEIIMIREDKELSSPVSVLNYEYYKNVKNVGADISEISDKIQCVVHSESIVFDGIFANYVKFGDSQSPGLSDFADNVDTLSFLIR